MTPQELALILFEVFDSDDWEEIQVSDLKKVAEGRTRNMSYGPELEQALEAVAEKIQELVDA